MCVSALSFKEVYLMEEQQESSILGRYRTDLRGVVGSSASAYGYTLTVWSSGQMLSHIYGSPSPLKVFLFLGGAVLAFASVGVLAFGGVAKRFGGGSGRVELWGSFHLFSGGIAVGAAWLVGTYASSMPGWPLGAFAATAVYLSVVGAENTASEVARTRRRSEGDDL